MYIREWVGMGWKGINKQAHHHINEQSKASASSHINQSTSTRPTTNIINTPQTTTMPSNVLSTIAARAKAHHDSLNAAYQATYSPRTSTSTSTSTPYTPPTSRKSSTTSAASDSTQSDRNITKAWKALKQHHHDMNEAYSAYYAPGMSTAGSSRASSAAPSPKQSFEAEREVAEQGKPRNYERIWGAIKHKAVEHHRSVSNASAAVYGA